MEPQKCSGKNGNDPGNWPYWGISVALMSTVGGTGLSLGGVLVSCELSVGQFVWRYRRNGNALLLNLWIQNGVQICSEVGLGVAQGFCPEIDVGHVLV